MKKTIYSWLIATIVFAFIFQSCVKNTPILSNPFKDDKLLLSKVTGTNNPISWNSFEYTRDPTLPVWDYLATYAYSNEHVGVENLKPLQKVGFQNGGTWDLAYNNLFPYQIIDHSVPGVDQGYWQLYYNDKGQVVKTGLAFSTSAGPTQFEFYEYDVRGNLTSLIYGTHPDTPYFKYTYEYDERDNLDHWEWWFPNGYSSSAESTVTRNAKYNSSTYPGYSILSNAHKVMQSGNKAVAQSFNNGSSKNAPDSNVIYQLYVSIKITSDGRINPFHQQGGLLFYPGDRLYSGDINAYYLDLLKSNPLKVEWILNPDFGVDTAVSIFSYTYNQLGYPVTRHEEFNDPTDYIFGFGRPYVQDRQIEYIKNN